MARENASVAQLVEHHVANVIVAGSNPVTRSIFFASSTVLAISHTSFTLEISGS